MFSVIIPVTQIDDFILSTARILSQSDYVKQIILVNNSNKIIELSTTIPNMEVIHFFNDTPYNAFNKTIKDHVSEDKVIILDNNIQINPKFIDRIVTHYANSHLYTFKINTINKDSSVQVDKRTGNKIKPHMFNICAIAFDKDDALKVGCFKDKALIEFAHSMVNEGVTLKHLNNVLCHRVTTRTGYIPKEIETKKQKEKRQTVAKRSGGIITSRTKGMLGKLRRKPAIELNESKLMKDKGFLRRDLKRKISIIIPVMIKGDRYSIFLASLNCLYEHTKKYDNIEIVIHETDIAKKLPDAIIEKYNIKYCFSYWDKPFHRSWALNVPVKQVATGDTLVFFDADLLITKKWVEALLKCKKHKYYIGWGDLRYLSLENTELYKKTGKINDNEIVFLNRLTTRNLNTKTAFDIGCGGINVIPREMFEDIKGWPEDYSGLGYGGEDNSMNYKILSLGYRIEYFPIKVFHLYHGHTTETNANRFPIKKKHKAWTKTEWANDLKRIGDNWGIQTEQDAKEPIKTKHQPKIKRSTNLKILWLTLDRSNRVANHFDDFRDAFCNIADVTVLYQNLHDGLLPNKLHEEYLSGKRNYRPRLTGELNYDYIICDTMFLWMFEDWSKIEVPTAIIIEDQHGKVPKRQVDHAVKHNHTIIHRYRLNKFHKDLPEHIKTIWLPHSVNVSNFRDYEQEKEFGVLTSGSIGNVYKTRIAVDNALKGKPYYTRLQRPVDGTNQKQWPVQDEYSMELNKAWLSTCCGAILQYPVMKFFEIPASKSVLFSDYFPELGELGFKPNKNMITVDLDNIPKQAETLLKNKTKLKKIAQAGYDLIQERHTNEIRAQELLDIIVKECPERINDSLLNIKKLTDKYSILDYDRISQLLEKEEPMVTLAMLSFKRFDVLITSLKRHLENGTPLNLVLRVQCCEDLTKEQRYEIFDLADQFYDYDLQFTEKNLGSGIPRHDVMSRAIKKFDTPYILTTDDDMIWEPYSIISQVSLLEDKKEYGLISSTCNPNYPRMYKKGKNWKLEKVIKDQFVDANLIGSATSIYRREVFNTCEYDKNYTIGCGDYDLCMQINKAGWMIGVMNIPEFKSFNNNKGNTQEYRGMRYNKSVIKHSVALFKKKWGTIGIGGI